MLSNTEITKMIFGFKVKYLRQHLDLTYQQLAKKSGMSLSYIHEVEKGKKYPKPAKIHLLADALGTDYDHLVSTQADKKIQPIIDLLTSDFLQIFPLKMFGIDTYKLFELFSNAPDKVNAFISTLFNVSRQYQMKSESFYKTALRSYQDMYDNYFPELEKDVKVFKETYGVEIKSKYKEKELKNILLNEFGVKVDKEKLKGNKDLKKIRSYFSEKDKTLFINEGLKESQINFLLAREIGFHYLDLEDRPFVTRILEVESFEKLLNNFKASYFSAAFLMDEKLIVKDVLSFSQLPEWNGDRFIGFLDDYNVTPEMLLQRLTNILPRHFGLNELFFLRLTGKNNLKQFGITKEIHLSRLHNPYANENNEHYCRKWVSLNIIKKLRTQKSLGQKDTVIADLQISDYWESPNEYLCLSFAKADDDDSSDGVSVTLGLHINDELRKMIRFLGDPNLPKRIVNTTCERCSVPDCENRAAPPITTENKLKVERIKEGLKEL